MSAIVQFSKLMEGEDLENKLDLDKIFKSIYDASCEPPKVISDILEALAGAIYLDSNMSLEKVWEVMQKFLLPFLDAYVNPTIAPLHPTSALVLACGQMGCAKVTFSQKDFEEDTEKHNQITIHVKVHDTILVTQSAKHKKAAKLLASVCALKKIEEEPGCIEKLCTCKGE